MFKVKLLCYAVKNQNYRVRFLNEKAAIMPTQATIKKWANISVKQDPS